MAQPIYKVGNPEKTLGGGFGYPVVGVVKTLYDTNGYGALMPVEFTQIGDLVYPNNEPHSVLYFKQKKSK